MGRAGKLAFALWTTIHGFACTSDAASVEFFIVDGYEFSSEERDVITSIANSTAREVKKLLPRLPSPVRVRVQAGSEE